MRFPYRQVVFLLGGRSQEPIGRSQQLARHFAEVAPVLYVPYGSLRHWLDGEWRHPACEPLSQHPNIPLLPNLGKLYQYPATRKSIGGTDLPQLQADQDMIGLTRNSEAFIDNLRKAWLTSNSSSHPHQQAAQDASWNLRAHAILDIVRNHHLSPRLREAIHASRR